FCLPHPPHNFCRPRAHCLQRETAPFHLLPVSPWEECLSLSRKLELNVGCQSHAAWEPGAVSSGHGCGGPGVDHGVPEQWSRLSELTWSQNATYKHPVCHRISSEYPRPSIKPKWLVYFSLCFFFYFFFFSSLFSSHSCLWSNNDVLSVLSFFAVRLSFFFLIYIFLHPGEFLTPGNVCFLLSVLFSAV
ncbi:hypothetical protein ANANG_G00274690, partial [Anguilla anguilla]